MQAMSQPLATNRKKYVVIENAGYEGECDVHFATSHEAAIAWRDQYYEDGEIERLHVEIARELPDGSKTYEF